VWRFCGYGLSLDNNITLLCGDINIPGMNGATLCVNDKSIFYFVKKQVRIRVSGKIKEHRLSIAIVSDYLSEYTITYLLFYFIHLLLSYLHAAS
jgi:hypothetical protein